MSTNEKTEKMSLAQKLARIGNEIGKVEKSGKNTGYGANYNFIEYGVVAGRIRTLFDEYGVIIRPEIQNYDAQEISSKNGAGGYHFILTMKFTIVNGEDPKDTMESMWLGEATDYGDKGINKAITAGTKYFLMRLFNISEKADEDPDGATPEARQPQSSAVADYAKVRARLKQLTSKEDVEEGWRKFVEAEPDIPSARLKIMRRMFDERLAQLEEAD